MPRDVINLRMGVPYFPTPPVAVAAAAAAAARGATGYTPAAGTPELREAVAAKFRADGFGCEPGQTIVGAGAKALMFVLLLADDPKGREVIIPAPYYPGYVAQVRIVGGLAKIVSTDYTTGYKLTPESLDAALSRKTRWVVLNSPSNPSGATYTAEEVRALGEILARYPDVLILSDELYDHYVYEGSPVSFAATCPELADRTITLNGASKTYSMPGWRIGFAAGPRWLIDTAIKVQGNLLNCASSISQAAALAALGMDTAELQPYFKQIRRNRDLAVATLGRSQALRVAAPAGAFYLLPRFERGLLPIDPALSAADADAAFTALVADRAAVIVGNGSNYGAPAHFRMNFAVHEDLLTEACDRLVSALDALRPQEAS